MVDLLEAKVIVIFFDRFVAFILSTQNKKLQMERMTAHALTVAHKRLLD